MVFYKGGDITYFRGDIINKTKSILLLAFTLVLMVSVFACDSSDPVDKPEIEGMVLVEAGTTSPDNGEIKVEEDFYIGKYPVTQAEFEDVMGFNLSEFTDENHENLTGDSNNRPVEWMTWYDAVMYCNKLSELENLDEYYNIDEEEYHDLDRVEYQNITVTENEGANGYRLPTEDEWEYAARGGVDGAPTTYVGSNDLDEIGWYRRNSNTANSDRINKRGTMPVGEKKANELGIYDMSGNVYEWTNTPYSYNKILRGGGWNNHSHYCEVDYRRDLHPSHSNMNFGFRIARSF